MTYRNNGSEANAPMSEHHQPSGQAGEMVRAAVETPRPKKLRAQELLRAAVRCGARDQARRRSTLVIITREVMSDHHLQDNIVTVYTPQIRRKDSHEPLLSI